MSKGFIAICALALVAAVSGQNASQPERQCTAAGSICSRCDTVAVCVGTGDGGFQELSQPCQPTENCVSGICVPGALCNYRPFNCTDEGYFPDPYDCQRYHICLPGVGNGLVMASFACPVGSAYNASSQDCSASTLSAACLDRPVPECVSRLQIGPIPDDSNLYYICIERDSTLAPELRRCPAGRTFDSIAVSCVDAAPKDDGKKKKKSKSKA